MSDRLAALVLKIALVPALVFLGAVLERIAP
jgi:hypothetical protein